MKKPSTALVRSGWTAVAVLSLIGVAIVIRRTVALSLGTTGPAGVDSSFAHHATLTFSHILPALLFIALGPFQFMRSMRQMHPALHRRCGLVFVGSGMIAGITALIMSPQMAIGGPNETVATTVFACVFLFALTKGFISARRRDFLDHREWMIRAYAIGLAVATIRPIVGMFFASRALTGLTPREFFGTAFWLGFTIHFIAAETWINYTRPRLLPERKDVIAPEPVAHRNTSSAR